MPIKKYHYVFALDDDDFALFTGGKGFTSQYGGTKGKQWFSTNTHIYVQCNKPEDIRGYTNIEVSITKPFKESESHAYLLDEIKKEISICNFKSNDYFKKEYIPNVLKELMIEQYGKELMIEQFRYPPIVGMVVESCVDFPSINVKKRDKGIVVKLYGNNLESCIVLFRNGESCGFNRYEQIEFLKFNYLSKNEEIRKYKYNSETHLREDYKEGKFDEEFY